MRKGTPGVYAPFRGGRITRLQSMFNATKGESAKKSRQAREAKRKNPEKVLFCSAPVEGGLCGAVTPDPRIPVCAKHGGDEMLRRINVRGRRG